MKWRSIGVWAPYERKRSGSLHHTYSTHSSNTVFQVVAKNTVSLVSGVADLISALALAVFVA
jgi:hypothetical protein